jgi:CheY-like chemotaxis protein
LRKKVLIIEDEKIDAVRIGRVISEQFPGVSLEVLTTGEQALDWLLRFRGGDGTLSLILMDLSIPRMHGLELLVEFQRNDFVKEVPIVILSGSEDPEAVRLAYSAGASAYVLKPAMAAEMSAALASTLDFWLNVNRVAIPARVADKQSC